MTDRDGVDWTRSRRVAFGPWTNAGAPDPDYDQATRVTHHALLTDPQLLKCFRRRFPEHGRTSYDAMVRLLGYVWDCPHDRTANVTGHRCARCRQTRAAAEETAAHLHPA
jgi:hypothetical protein